jgi:hypothetical protein
METELTIKARLKYFYGEKTESCAALDFLKQDLVSLSNKYPKICTNIWVGDIASMYLMTNSTVRVIMLTKDKRLIIGRINGASVIVDKLECGITDDSVLLTEAKIVIVL